MVQTYRQGVSHWSFFCEELRYIGLLVSTNRKNEGPFHISSSSIYNMKVTGFTKCKLFLLPISDC